MQIAQKLLCMIVIVMSSVGATGINAPANGDEMFDACINILNRNPIIIKMQHRSETQLPANIEKVVEPMLIDAHVLRWILNKNDDGSLTFLVLTRSDESQTMDDYDLFDIIRQKDNVTSLAEIVSTNAMAFTKKNNLGVAGVLSCTEEAPSNGILEWNGHVWN